MHNLMELATKCIATNIRLERDRKRRQQEYNESRKITANLIGKII